MLIVETVLTAGFLLVILGATAKLAPHGFAPIAIGLTLIHLISIPVTNTSVNPACGVALFAQTGALGQLWLFWAAPLIGAEIGALVWKYVLMPGEGVEGLASNEAGD